MKTPKELTPDQMRVAIAKDVIKQIDAHIYKATQGIYFKQIIGMDGPFPIHRDKYFNPITQTNVGEIKSCQVCAIGSVILSGIRLFNEVEFGRTHKASYDAVQIWFDMDQAILIEKAFEWQSTRFYKRYPAATDRLKAIMKNIIRNKGKFVPRKAEVKDFTYAD